MRNGSGRPWPQKPYPRKCYCLAQASWRQHYLFAIYSNHVEHILKMSALGAHALYDFFLFFQNWSNCEFFVRGPREKWPTAPETSQHSLLLVYWSQRLLALACEYTALLSRVPCRETERRDKKKPFFALFLTVQYRRLTEHCVQKKERTKRGEMSTHQPDLFVFVWLWIIWKNICIKVY